MKHAVYHCLKAAQVITSWVSMFFLSVAISWKLKARRAAKGVQYRPRIFSFHVITRVGLRRALPSFRIPALRKHCGPCEAHYVPEGSAVFRHPHLLSIFRFTLHTSRRKWASCTGHQLREDLTKAMMTCYDQIDEWLSSKSSSNLKLSIVIHLSKTSTASTPKLQSSRGSETPLGLQTQRCQQRAPRSSVSLSGPASAPRPADPIRGPTSIISTGLSTRIRRPTSSSGFTPFPALSI